MGKPEVSAVEAVLAEQQGASFTLHGAGVSGGIAIGYAHLISSARLEVAHYEIARGEIDAEIVRFDAAVEQVRGELIGLHAAVPADAPAEMGAFLDLHLMIEQPEQWVAQYADAGADIITVHAEATRHLHRVLEAIHLAGKKASVAVNPATPLEAVRYVLDMAEIPTGKEASLQHHRLF